MAEDSRCQNCGNAGHFSVVVTNREVSGKWCRNSCSRLCGEILARRGMDEMDLQSNFRAKSTYELLPQLTGRPAQTVHLG